MNHDQMMLTIVPFSGFYYSTHDATLDHACELILSDDRGDCVHDALPLRLSDAVDWGKVHEAYARQYATEWADRLGVNGLTFDELSSPREYNFSTDRIFARVPLSELQRIRDALQVGALEKVARAWFTSRSGFMSFYDPDVSTWGELSTWDHNQVGAMLQAWQDQEEGEDFDESRITEDWPGNGMVDNWILSTPAAVHVANLAYRIRRMRGEV